MSCRIFKGVSGFQTVFVSVLCFAYVVIQLFLRAMNSRIQIQKVVYFDPTTGITSVILTNTELIGPKKFKEIDDLPLIVVNIPPVLNKSGHDAIVKDAKSLESWVVKVLNLKIFFLSLYK